jgi:uncharacterized protein YjbI with pentapeptide repeats
MISFKVFSRLTGALQFTAKIDCDKDEPDGVKLGLAVLWAYETGASLVEARLDGASLDGARLDGASLDRASLVGARLVGASLDGASLDRASLVGARLVGASLDGARLDRASLDGARLVGASLDGARLVGKEVQSLCARVTRTDGHEFQMWLFKDGSHVIRAGCQTRDLDSYRKHVAADYPGRSPDPTVETLAILDFLEARLRAVVAESAVKDVAHMETA